MAKQEMTKGRKQFLHTVFITAMEGGINCWAETHSYHWGTDGGVKVVDDIDQFYAVILPAEGFWGVNDAFITDSYAPPFRGQVGHKPIGAEQPLTINIDVMQRGADALVDKVIAAAKSECEDAEFSRKYLRQFVEAWLTDGDDGDFDAEVADMVVQLGLFGQVVYG